jgi:hypothetical protein
MILVLFLVTITYQYVDTLLLIEPSPSLSNKANA